MSREEFLEILEKELKRLEEVEHVSDLANNWRCSEVDAILAEIDYSALNEYMEECDHYADLEVSEIPGGRYLAFVIYLFGSKHDECAMMESWEELQEVLYGCGEAGEAIANTMNSCCINEFTTFEGLLNCEEEDEEDDADDADDEDDEDDEEADQGNDE